MSDRIEDYALIGDCETAALVSRSGSVDWLCWPSFSSPACFAALVGNKGNGHWSLAPKNARRITRRYVEHTLVLETRFESPHGCVLLLDFMPIRDRNSDLIRIVRGVRGAVPMQMELVLRFDYGSTIPWVSRMQDGGLRAVAGPDMVLLHSSVATYGENLKTMSEFTIREGESATFQLIYGASFKNPPKPVDAEKALEKTIRFWQRWSGKANLNGEYTDPAERSLITLKALTFRQTGGIVAAPTSSLPEYLGGRRNWDYRYCWLRDATFTLLALMNAGYFEEAHAWRDWLLRAAAGTPDKLQIMYGIHGERQLMEWEASWLDGYAASKPVRIGNGAAGQLQLDVYGEMADAAMHGHLGGIEPTDTSYALHRSLTNHLAKIWDRPDQGLWEIRGDPQHFTYSKVMAWVAFDRAIKTTEKFGLKGDVRRWRRLRKQVHDEVCAKGYDSERGCFTQSYGSDEVDASLLLVPLVGFLPWTDPRIRGTVEAIERDLTVDGLVQRYRTDRIDDGLPAGEGAFLACSFWMVSALRMLGRESDAKAMFDRLLALRNDVGLLAEEYDPTTKRQVGNFPQALSHIALVNAAYEFMRASSPGRQRAQSTPARPDGER